MSSNQMVMRGSTNLGRPEMRVTFRLARSRIIQSAEPGPIPPGAKVISKSCGYEIKHD